MKKAALFIFAVVYVFSLSGCQKGLKGSELYSFPEPTTLITGVFYTQGQENAFEIGSEDYDPNNLSTNSVIQWFYDLKLTPFEKPEEVVGGEKYTFEVNGDEVFTYEDRGEKAYIVIDDVYYRVSNPSAPPIN